MFANGHPAGFRWALLFVLLLAVAGAATAQGASPWYVDARIGEAATGSRFGTVHPKFFDDEAESYAVDLGYLVNPYFAVQLGYEDLGRHTGFGSPCPEDVEICIETLCPIEMLCSLVATPLDVDLSAWSVVAVPRWPVTDRFSVHAKLGVASWQADVSGLLATRSTERFSGTDFLAGAGLRYAFPSGFGMVLEHNRFDPEIRSTSFGMSWRF